jgi:hypothetical protein
MSILNRIPPLGLIGRGLNRTYYNSSIFPGEYNPGGIDIFDQDWDVLIIIDGCRADVFEERAPQAWQTSIVESKASATIEFLHANFADGFFDDTVYITANPQLKKHNDEINALFFEENQLWSGNTWDDNLGTVQPEDVAQEARRANDAYPNKRLLIHFMQPHYPFRNSPFDSGSLITDEDEKFFWHRLVTGELQLNPSEIWDAYVDNLDWVLEEIQDLLPDLDGKVILTSDHGNMIGENSSPVPTVEYGHPPGVYTRELVRVPWVEFPCETRRDVQSGDTNSSGNIEADIESRLEDLGYR